MLTETVFQYPGVGNWIAQAIFNRDYPVIQGGILFLAFVFVLVNLWWISRTQSSTRESGSAR